ncbi:MAG TPA: AI-2E family transporter, partial [Acidimicrobiia bacterium]|nr:AI-2E family transporter [Acidimicrobiia bacterium]
RMEAPVNGEEEELAPAWPQPGYWIRVAVAVIGIVVALRIVLLLQGVLLVVFASLVIALGLQPTIEFFERRGLGRGWALATIIIVVTAALVAGALVIVPTAIDQVDAIASSLPEIRQELRDMGGLGAVIADRLEFSQMITQDQETVTRTVGTAAATIFNLFTVGVLVPYFAHALPRMKNWVLRLVRREERADLLRLVNESTDRISGYILGNLTVSLVAGVVSYAAFRLMGLDYALVLALWVAFTDLIPVVGAFIGAVPAIAVAAQEGVGLVVAVAAFLTAYQLFENFVVQPRVMTKAIDLSPAAVIIAVMVGGTLAGVTGALLALPVAAMVKIAVEQYLISTRLDRVREDAAYSSLPRRRRGRSRPLP